MQHLERKGIKMKSENQLNLTIIALNRLNGLGKKKTRKFLENIEDKDHLDFFQALRQGIKYGVFQKKQPIGQFLDAEEYARKVIDKCEKDGINIVNIFSKDFPEALKFENPPLILFYKGDLSCLDNEKRAAIIGTRHPSETGKEFAYNTGKLLAQNGYTIISGLAQGCDTSAHQAALDNKAKTVAFVPSSVNRIAPHVNEELAKQIIDNNGLVISEYSPLSTPNSNMYITRDRLQAGSSQMVFASEFDSQSGTLQTLEFAAKFKKPIYTLKSLTEEKEFNGFASLKDLNIDCNALDWEQIEKLVTGAETSEES